MEKRLIIFNLNQSNKKKSSYGIIEKFYLRYLFPLFIKFLMRLGFENSTITKAVRKSRGKYFVFSCDIYEAATFDFIKKITENNKYPFCYFVMLKTMDECTKDKNILIKQISQSTNRDFINSDGNELGLIGVDETNMTTLSQAAQCEQLATSITSFEKIFGEVPIPIYSYPQGAYDVDLINALKSFGFRAAVCNAIGINDANSDPFQLRRIFFNPFSFFSYFKTVFRILKLINKQALKTKDSELKSGEIIKV